MKRGDVVPMITRYVRRALLPETRLLFFRRNHRTDHAGTGRQCPGIYPSFMHHLIHRQLSPDNSTTVPLDTRCYHANTRNNGVVEPFVLIVYN